ncbi:ribonuclease HII [Actinoallomurus sp. NPDC052308]|uniref:ribonuclease HII n=1 Tax=Actinoallomurus sp. NPDC052308 TaxID=3155530 RepID=UPI00341F9D80
MYIDVRAHRPRGLTPRRDVGLYAYERVVERCGLGPVAGVDEAGRGACAGPLVVAAVILAPERRRRIEGLADSKLLTAARRERLYEEITTTAMAWHALIVPREEIDRVGVHRCNVAGMRRALAALSVEPGYVLTDGFRVPGICAPGLPVPKGDRVAACVAAASIVAKVTRDRIMMELHERYPMYGFGVHKGYVTRAHAAALEEHGPCPEHRLSFVNVARAVAAEAGPEIDASDAGEIDWEASHYEDTADQADVA